PHARRKILMVYLDTSVLISQLVAEPESGLVADWLGKQQDALLGTSSWTIVEFSSALGIKVRRKALGARIATEARAKLASLIGESLVVVAPLPDAFLGADRLLANPRWGLRAGDALHLAAAMQMGADIFATLDRQLVKAISGLRLPFKAVGFHG